MFIKKSSKQTIEERDVMVDNLELGIEAYEKMSAARHESEMGGNASFQSLSNKDEVHS